MKECKILKFYYRVGTPERLVETFKFKGVSYKNEEFDGEAKLYDHPALETKLNEYLKNGWEIKIADIGRGEYLLERDV